MSLEWLSILLMIPIVIIATVLCVIWGATGLFVYLDVEQRAKGRAIPATVAIAVCFFYWPISFIAYLLCTRNRERPNEIR